MKKIINQKRYNTDAAKLIVEFFDDLPADNPRHCEYNRLYRKQTGEFFLHGKGGAESIYASVRKNIFCGGENLVPISMDEAKNICLKHLSKEEYNLAFGQTTTEDRKQINIQIDSGTWNMLQTLKGKTKKSANEIILELIRKEAEGLKE